MGELANWAFVGANLGGIAASFLASAALARWAFGRSPSTSAMRGMIASFGNTGYMGIPLLIAAFGSGAALPASLATVIHNVPVIAAVIFAFEVSEAASREEGKEGSGKARAVGVGVARAIVLNPINLSVAAGTAVAALGVGLPEPAGVFAGLLRDAAGPTALFSLGLALVGRAGALRQEGMAGAEIATPVALKLVLQPLEVAFLVLYVFEMEPLWAATAVLMSALPVGANVYVFAQRYDDSVEQASLAVLVSTVVSVLTVSALLAIVVGRV